MAISSSTGPKATSLLDRLKDALPNDFRCRVRYIRSSPKRCDPLFSPAPGCPSETTHLSSHFLLVSVNASLHSKNQTSAASPSDVTVLGIEVLVYKTKALTTIFVSKADSTGYLPSSRPSPVKIIATTFVRYLAAEERRKNWKRKIVLSLFARSQSQYLFPGSAENTGKHILDDRQLIKWWARVLDPLFSELKQDPDSRTYDCNGYITVPGYDGQAEMRQFLPPPNASDGQHWKAGHPLYELARERSVPEDAPPRCMLPRFPDDPKARFIQELDDEVGISDESGTTTSPSKRKTSKWNSIRDLNRFWEAMEFRQECSSGRVVGFLWVVIRPRRGEEGYDPAEKQELSQGDSNAAESGESQNSSQGSWTASQRKIRKTFSQSPKIRRKALTGPIVARQPRLKGSSSTLSATSDPGGLVRQDGIPELVTNNDGYTKAMHTLLHLDFANLDVAIQSTSKWNSEVASVCGVQKDWSCEVVGTAKTVTTADSGSTNGQVVNDLGGMIKRKRKAEEPTTLDNTASSQEPPPQPAVNMLGAGLIRKKPKPAVS